MFETAIRQLRMAMAMIWGRPINPRNLELLVDDVLKTLEEFGEPGDDVQQLLEGPFADPKDRKEFQNRSLQLTARRLMRVSPYYQKLFATHQVDPDNLTVDDLPKLPTTRKRDLQADPHAFLTKDGQPALTTRTTGTTGTPTEIWISRYEIQLWSALSALSGLLRGEIGPSESFQVNISSRATAAIQMNLDVARLAHARTRILGIIDPEESLTSLATTSDDAPTQMSTYPSYLARLINTARRMGMTRRDFHLKRVISGGEILSPALTQAAIETFGVREVSDTFGMTEVLPVSGRVCSHGHLHLDLNTGHIEVISLDTDQPATPGELGTLVITPYYPYRECMPVFRYDTRDVVRVLPDEPLHCEFAASPGTSAILGKADHLLRLPDRIVTPREILEVYEALPSQPWPARFSAQVVEQHIELTIPEAALTGITRSQVERRFTEAGLDVRIADGSVVSNEEMAHMRPIRADLLETTFAGRK